RAFEPVMRVGAVAPFTIRRLARDLFGSEGNVEVSAARGTVRAMVLARGPDSEGREVAPLPFRVHYFFHNAGRLWACVNPLCGGRQPDPAGRLSPPVGRLYSEPRPRCDFCGARVLELLYCQPCGEVFIGGFKKCDPSTAYSWYV